MKIGIMKQKPGAGKIRIKKAKAITEDTNKLKEAQKTLLKINEQVVL